MLAPEVRELTLLAFRHIAASLIVYDLKRIDEDLLKQLYQNLVEEETRHELGEFYTPDWLAELTLREVGFQYGQSLLDPACGSGAFLFTAIRLLVEQGNTGSKLVDFALENIVGMDVHPLAVTIARINYMLAILPHLSASGKKGQRAIPIALANSLQMPNTSNRIKVIEVPLDGHRSFQIPVEAARQPAQLAEVLREMGRYAASMANTPNASYTDFGRFVQQQLPRPEDPQQSEVERLAWINNARYLAEQIAKGRDSIWVYVLLNTSRPLILQHRRFDMVIGNPPWIAYRFLQDATYQHDVKELTREYGLLESGDVKLNTQIELSTLFFEHCTRVYLKSGGTIAFVMPRSVITGAKQHRAFQEKGFSRVLDLKAVAPLFNVETCVMIRSGGVTLTQDIPTTHYAGRLRSHECKWADAEAMLVHDETTTTFTGQEVVASPYYHSRMLSGANIYPRTLAFVTSAQPDLTPGQLTHTNTGC